MSIGEVYPIYAMTFDRVEEVRNRLLVHRAGYRWHFTQRFAARRRYLPFLSGGVICLERESFSIRDVVNIDDA